MRTLTATDNSYSTIKSAQIALSKLKSGLRDRPFFKSITWRVKPAPCQPHRGETYYVGVGEVEDGFRYCRECNREMGENEHNYGTGCENVCIQCAEMEVEPEITPLTVRKVKAMFEAMDHSEESRLFVDNDDAPIDCNDSDDRIGYDPD